MVCDMNIFAIDLKPSVCASCHTDRHIIKMPLETAQMLSFVYYHADYWNKPIPNLLSNEEIKYYQGVYTSFLDNSIVISISSSKV
mgnify:CR=1 FL=1